MLVIPADNRIMYFRRDREMFEFLSHFYRSQIQLDGDSWPTVEHYYQAQKSLDPTYRQAVRDASTPSKAKTARGFAECSIADLGPIVVSKERHATQA